MTGLIYDDTPAYPVARRIKRGPRPDEERALRDLRRAMTGAIIDIARERRLEEARGQGEARSVSEQVHGVCGACGSGITVEDGLVVGRDDADLLDFAETIIEWETSDGHDGTHAGPCMGCQRVFHARAAIAKAKGEA